MHFHWQNLNRDHRDNVKGSGLKHGRAWLHLNSKGGYDSRTIRTEWLFGKSSCAAWLIFNGGEHEVLGHLSLPYLFSIYLGTNVRWRWLWKKTGYNAWRLGFRFHSWAFWWSGFENEMSWHSTDPWYRRFNVNFLDTLLGSTKHSQDILEEKDVVIPMPEGSYPAHAKLTVHHHKRPRWFRQDYYTCEIDVPKGIPHEGKGENAWDCGKDAIFGQSSPAKTFEEGIANLVQSALRNRRRYDGNINAVYPSP